MYMPFQLSSSPPLPRQESSQMSQAAPSRTAAATGSQAEPPRILPLVRVIAMPADANPNGDIFGGWLLAQMDLAGGSLATQRAQGRCATVAVDGMVFHEPVFVGDEVSCYGELIRTGRSSMTVRIEAWRRHLPSDKTRKVTEAIFTYVAIGEDRRPRRLPTAI
jgi:acyl-CoA thioesterase YciA